MASTVTCPACSRPIASIWINQHLDSGCASSTPTSSQASASSGGATNASSSGSLSTGSKRKAGGDALASNGSKKGKATNSSAVADVKPRLSAPTSKPTAFPSQSTSTFVSTAPPPSKRFKTSSALESAKPLAERMRPSSLEDLVGQEQLLGEGALLRGLIEGDKVGSVLFWGPPGTGKTTIARVIAHSTSSVFKELSATNASTADLRKVFEEATNLLKLTGRKTVLFIDEIQRFNKAQQDSLLPVVEAGIISLIASTTENPSFRVNSALLSRCRVFVLNKLSAEDIYRLLVRALKKVFTSDEPPESSKQGPSTSSPTPSTSALPSAAEDSSTLPTGPIDESLLRFLASAADGDARVALSSLELAISATKHAKGPPLTREELKAQLRKAHLQYDRTGDHHYDTISALHKAVRGSDADAALYWLARMLQGGDDPLYVARRLIRMASEDIGLANPSALPQAVAAYQATQLLGMPECDCILAQVVVMLAESPKSVRTYKAYGKAKALVANVEAWPVPMHIRNAPTGLMKSLGYGQDYMYNPAYLHPVTQPFLPPELVGRPEAHFLQDEESVEGKKYDEAALREWEWKELGGKKWEGREEMMRRLEEGGALGDGGEGGRAA
ncbi:hypothetical protein BCR35DRAFT_307958 [Leucosporidium creatinivorum]|uniref:AAA+ ATPase domain-containing protein n=1 Tax=Leucosporidium creatinivorum TaxID=106004 RepID=A0A1Y2EGF5_9BASI|nr:hypothetical protein BCR35DRAFT_307958 [Leucosporidium creatinivorum]